MYELKVENENGKVLDLADSSDYKVYKITGLNPVKAKITKSANSTSDGSVINQKRVEVRNIVIYIALQNDVEESRLNLYQFFTTKSDVTLYFKSERRNVLIKGTVESTEIDLYSINQTAQVSILCANPYFKDVDVLTSEFAQLQSEFEFPFSLTEEGLTYSRIASDPRTAIFNAGDIESGIEITIYAMGPVENPVVYDVLKHTHMKLNITLQDSDKLVINTNINEKSIRLVRNGVTSNAIGNLVPDSAWLTLAAYDNVFTYDAERGSADMRVEFKTSVLFGGI